MGTTHNLGFLVVFTFDDGKENQFERVNLPNGNTNGNENLTGPNPSPCYQKKKAVNLLCFNPCSPLIEEHHFFFFFLHMQAQECAWSRCTLHLLSPGWHGHSWALWFSHSIVITWQSGIAKILVWSHWKGRATTTLEYIVVSKGDKKTLNRRVMKAQNTPNPPHPIIKVFLLYLNCWGANCLL